MKRIAAYRIYMQIVHHIENFFVSESDRSPDSLDGKVLMSACCLELPQCLHLVSLLLINPWHDGHCFLSLYSNPSFELKILNIGDPFYFSVIPLKYPQISINVLKRMDRGLRVAGVCIFLVFLSANQMPKM